MNRTDLAESLVSALRQLQQAQEHGGEAASSVRSAPNGARQSRVANRLSEAEIERLIAAFGAGTSRRKLAERYGISESSVKRLVRRQGASKASNGSSGSTCH